MDLKQLVRQANELDKQGKHKEADLLDRQIKRYAEEDWGFEFIDSNKKIRELVSGIPRKCKEILELLEDLEDEKDRDAFFLIYSCAKQISKTMEEILQKIHKAAVHLI